MKISARNQLKGTVKSIETGSVNAIVHIDIGNGNVISSTISIDAVKELGLAVGKEAVSYTHLTKKKNYSIALLINLTWWVKTVVRFTLSIVI